MTVQKLTSNHNTSREASDDVPSFLQPRTSTAVVLSLAVLSFHGALATAVVCTDHWIEFTDAYWTLAVATPPVVAGLWFLLISYLSGRFRWDLAIVLIVALLSSGLHWTLIREAISSV
jgi:hypothetical protein